VIERLARYVAIPSLSRQESALADQVSADLARHDLLVQRRGNNVWCTLGDAARPRLLLNSHLDTVPAAAGWTGDPWQPQGRPARVTGLGANDAKGCAVALLEAVLRVQARLQHGERLGGTIVLALTAEEETSGEGLGTILPELTPLDAALVGEPTGFVPMTAQRGLLVLRGVARGRSGHPAHTPPSVAQNAILTAAHDFTALQSFDWGPPHPMLGRRHAHVTRIHGGIANNVIPDACEFILDVRTTPLESHPVLHARLAGALASELHVHSDRLVPVETAVEEPIVRAVLRARPGVRPTGSPAMSDMVFLAGIPSVKIGPGEPSRSHTADEYLAADELLDGVETYERIVHAYFALARGERAVCRGRVGH
jgi:acetylornithine deacetylase